MNRLQSKFRGCLIGAVVGDCLGAEYEGEDPVSNVILNKFFANLSDDSKGRLLYMYTDDTAMTRSLAESLIQKDGFDAKDCAGKFQLEYSNSPRRGYGANVINVFKIWSKNPNMDVLQPAREQFDGKGSFGNGAAMRVAPVALYSNNDVEKAKIIAKESALLTHTNKNAYNGAILQCLAVIQALRMDVETPLEPFLFIDYLILQMRSIESEQQLCDNLDAPVELPYCNRLAKAKELLARETVLDETVVQLLGNDISALGSVPTAIFAFLYALRDIENINSKGHFAQTIHYAISLGGDTDTIATMAGAIAGAYLGEEAIPAVLQKHCEGLDVALQHSNRLYDLSQNRK